MAKGEFYTFKEIEKIATQQKKIVMQSVKEILQSLVDDNLVISICRPLWEVSSDKIGTSIYYWSFPSDTKKSRQTKIEELNKESQIYQQRQLELRTLIDEASNSRQDSVCRYNLLMLG